MVVDPETMFRTHAIDQFSEQIALKLNQAATLGAVQMIMLRIPIIVLIDSAAVELETVQKTRIDEFFERPVNSRLADVILMTLAGKVLNQRVSVKVLVPRENLLDEKSSLLRLAQATALQVLFETLLRR
jgi:hypothetical protein